MTLHVALYVQHLLGTGHYVRALALCRGMTTRGFNVTLITGGVPVPGDIPQGTHIVQLTPIRAADAAFSGLVTENGEPVTNAVKSQRTAALIEAVTTSRADVVITELFPFGRRQMRFELMPLLEALHRTTTRPLILVSIRDILIPPSNPEKLGKTLDIFEKYYDSALVHGDRSVIPLKASYPAAREIADKLHYTGYVTDPAAAAPPVGDDGRDEVIVAAGGGAVGGALMRTALEACKMTSAGPRKWRFLLGPLIPDDARNEIRAAARDLGADRLIAEPVRQDYRALLGRAALSISQGGYNTMMDLLVTGVRAVIVPFSEGRESEQPTRSRLFAERSLAVHLSEEDLNGPSLEAAIRQGLALPIPATSDFRLDGAAETARIIQQMVESRS